MPKTAKADEPVDLDEATPQTDHPDVVAANTAHGVTGTD